MTKPSVKKDLPVCQSCFDQIYALERATVRNKPFEPASYIGLNIYLGGENSAINLEYLRENKIDRIALVAIFCNPFFTLEKDGIDYLIVEVDDSPEENIAQHFDKISDFIDRSPETNVLIHCASGISRSGASVIAYFMRKQGLSFEESWQFVRSKRPQVHPNSGFQRQLQEYEHILK